MSRKPALFLALLAIAAPSRAAENAVPAAALPPTAAQAPITLLQDLSSGQVLFAREADRRFLPASITKVMTALVAFEMLEDGRLAARQNYTVKPAIAREWSGKGTSMFVKGGDQLSVEQLLRGITTVSANDACVVLADGASGSVANWVALMNRRARALGMADSHFGTPNGWPDEGRTYVTGRDLVRLAQALIDGHPAYYRDYIGKRSFSVNGVERRNHDPISGVVEGADGIKTGHTREAGYTFLGSAQRDGRRLVMVIAGAPSEAVRAQVSRDLIEWGFTAFESRPLFAANAIVGQASVQDGAHGSVPLRTPRAIFASVPKGSSGTIRLALHYKGPVKAPIAAGDKVAELEIRVDGLPPSRLPLLAARGVAQAGPLVRIWNGLKGLFG